MAAPPLESGGAEDEIESTDSWWTAGDSESTGSWLVANGEASVQADAPSVATVDDTWMVVDDEEYAEDAHSGEEPTPAAQVACQGASPATPPSATLVTGKPLELGGPLLAEQAGSRADVTAQWAAALAAFAGVTGAYCVGRALVAPGADAGSPGLCAVARVVVRNDGLAEWPPTTTLRAVAGDCHGLDVLQAGGLLPGQAAELVLDLDLAPQLGSASGGSRSGWVLVDDCGRPFGPLLVFEFQRVEIA